MTKENTRTPLLLTLYEEISLEMQPHLWHVKILRHACCIMCYVLFWCSLCSFSIVFSEVDK